MVGPRRVATVSAGLGAIGAVAILTIVASAADLSSAARPVPSDVPSPSPVPGDLPVGMEASASPAASAGPSTAPAPSASVAELTIKGFAFAPPTLTVTADTTLIWTNLDLVGHTVTSVHGLFASSLLQNGETFELTLDEPGTYAYFCAVHPTMTGTIEVVG